MGMLRAYWVCSVHSVHSVRCMWTRCIQCTRCAACVLGALHMYSVRCMCIRRLWFVQCTRCTWRVQSLIVSTNRSSHSHSITRLVSAKAHVHRQPLQPQSSAPRNPAGVTSRTCPEGGGHGNEFMHHKKLERPIDLRWLKVLKALGSLLRRSQGPLGQSQCGTGGDHRAGFGARRCWTRRALEPPAPA